MRVTGQKIPDDTTLQSKLILVESQLNRYKEKILRNEIVLREITEITYRFSDMANKNRRQNLSLMDESNQLKNKYNKLIRKLMTLVSELSLYQAQIVQLKEQKGSLELQVKGIEDRVIEHQPPQDSSELHFLQKIQQNKKFQIKKLKNQKLR